MQKFKDVKAYLADTDDVEIAMAAISEMKNAGRVMVELLESNVQNDREQKRAIDFVANAVNIGIQGALTGTESPKEVK